jgi:hypothetical protein
MQQTVAVCSNHARYSNLRKTLSKLVSPRNPSLSLAKTGSVISWCGMASRCTAVRRSQTSTCKAPAPITLASTLTSSKTARRIESTRPSTSTAWTKVQASLVTDCWSLSLGPLSNRHSISSAMADTTQLWPPSAPTARLTLLLGSSSKPSQLRSCGRRITLWTQCECQFVANNSVKTYQDLQYCHQQVWLHERQAHAGVDDQV